MLEASFSGIIAVAFAKSRGIAYDAAINFARQAQRFETAMIGDTQYNFASFGKTPNQVAIAISLLETLHGKTGVQVMAAGRRLAHAGVAIPALQCYLTSADLSDPRAHCTMIVPVERLRPDYEPKRAIFELNLFEEKPAIEITSFPCRHLLNRGFKFQPGHPSTDAAQIEAAAAREGCGWCPNLKLD